MRKRKLHCSTMKKAITRLLSEEGRVQLLTDPDKHLLTSWGRSAPYTTLQLEKWPGCRVSLIISPQLHRQMPGGCRQWVRAVPSLNDCSLFGTQRTSFFNVSVHHSLEMGSREGRCPLGSLPLRARSSELLGLQRLLSDRYLACCSTTRARMIKLRVQK